MSITITETDAAIADAWGSPDHAEWFQLGARFMEHVNALAGRGDLLVRVAPSPAALTGAKPSGPAAMFVPSLAEVRVVADQVFPVDTFDPARFDPQDARDRATQPAAMGAVAHEAAHAAHTRLAFEPGADRKAQHYAILLEEPRIERALIEREPGQRVFLRACASQIVGTGDLDDKGSDPSDGDGDGGDERDERAERYQAIRSTVLILGREHAGVFQPGEVTPLREAVEAVLGADDLAAAETVVAAAVRLDDGDVDGLMHAGAQLAALVGPDDEGADEQGDPQGGTDGHEGQDGDDSQGEASRMPCGSWTDGDIPQDTNPWDTPGDGGQPDASPVTDAAASVTQDVSDDAESEARVNAGIAAPALPAPRDPAEQVAARSAAATFGRSSAMVANDIPTQEAREQARILTSRLRRASYRGVARTRVASIAPPGRMKVAKVMAQDAQRAMRVPVTATPFSRTHRREVPRPPLTVGISCDVSGTMESWQGATAMLTWALAQAVANLNGTVAAVAWDHSVYPTVKPGHAPKAMPVASCGGTSEGCPQSLRALNGALRLTADPTGARLVVIVTDGRLPNLTHVSAEIDRLADSGARVLWVRPARGSYGPPTRKAIDVPLKTPSEFADVLGRELVQALSQV